MGTDDYDRMLSKVSPAVLREIVAVLKAVYSGGYIAKTTSYTERRVLRGKCYQVLVKLGVEKS